MCTEGEYLLSLQIHLTAELTRLSEKRFLETPVQISR